MILQLGQFEIDVDADKTREFYKTMENVTEGCNCAGCRNYEKAVDHLPIEVKAFFDTLGIDMKKITEAFACGSNSNGTVLYWGFYHLCGRLLNEYSAATEIPTDIENTRIFQTEQNKAYPLTKDFHISFEEAGDALMEEGFPSPVLSLDIQANIPWVLNEENIYRK